MSTTQKDLWSCGVNAEVDFWDDWFLTKGSLWPQEYQFRINPDSLFQDYLTRFLPTDKKLIDILDVGAGPLTFLGKKLHADGRQLRITSTDPLADRYMVLLRKHNLNSNVFNVKANSEQLSNHFAENYFDFIYMRNALDHSFDPLYSVGEMIKVLDKGRYIVLEHETNEAENESYRDLHQWNIMIENGRFIIWNKSIKYDITEHYKDEADIVCTYISNGNYDILNRDWSQNGNLQTEKSEYNFIVIKKK